MKFIAIIIIIKEYLIWADTPHINESRWTFSKEGTRFLDYFGSFGPAEFAPKTNFLWNSNFEPKTSFRSISPFNHLHFETDRNGQQILFSRAFSSVLPTSQGCQIKNFVDLTSPEEWIAHIKNNVHPHCRANFECYTIKNPSYYYLNTYISKY